MTRKEIAKNENFSKSSGELHGRVEVGNAHRGGFVVYSRPFGKVSWKFEDGDLCPDDFEIKSLLKKGDKLRFRIFCKKLSPSASTAVRVKLQDNSNQQGYTYSDPIVDGEKIVYIIEIKLV